MKIGSESFSLNFVKGRKKKNVILELHKAKELIKNQGLKNLYIPQGITGTLIYNNLEILDSEKLTNIFRIIPYIDSDTIVGKKNLPRGNINILTGADKIMENLHLILSLSPLKNKSKQLGFISLNTDNNGNYWFKIVKSFDLALSASLESLVEFMDEIPQEMEKFKIEKINNIYRRLTEILEDQNSAID